MAHVVEFRDRDLYKRVAAPVAAPLYATAAPAARDRTRCGPARCRRRPPSRSSDRPLPEHPMQDYARARLNMVESQIRTNKVTDERLVDAFLTLPRERFVDEARRGIAYVDEDLPIGGGRCLMEPMVLARLLQAAAIAPGERALDVGCATGYSTAVLARVAGSVVGLECDDGLAQRARTVLGSLGLANASVVTGPLPEGRRGDGPYDVIVLQGAVPALPQAILDQLAPGGRLVAVVGAPGTQPRATLAMRVGDVASERVLFDANVAPLPGFERAAGFVF